MYSDYDLLSAGFIVRSIRNAFGGRIVATNGIHDELLRFYGANRDALTPANSLPILQFFFALPGLFPPGRSGNGPVLDWQGSIRSIVSKQDSRGWIKSYSGREENS